MTSATGEILHMGSRLRCPASGRAAARGRTGFTLVEIMVVMAIIVMLFGLVAVSLGQFTGRAAKNSTRALVLRLEQYLDQYHSLTGHYPPDGIDSPVRTKNGDALMSTAALYYALTNPVPVESNVGGRPEFREEPAIAKFRDPELTPADPDRPGVREIVDGFATPLHYDNTEDGVFRPQRGEVHIEPLDDDNHPADPRDGSVSADGKPVVARAGVQGSGFDIWSHGQQAHDVDAKPTTPIATWNTDD